MIWLTALLFTIITHYPLLIAGVAFQDRITINVPVLLYGAGRNDFDAGKSISRAIGRGGPWKSKLF